MQSLQAVRGKGLTMEQFHAKETLEDCADRL